MTILITIDKYLKVYIEKLCLKIIVLLNITMGVIPLCINGHPCDEKQQFLQGISQLTLIMSIKIMPILLINYISTIYHIFGREIWDKLPKYIFENLLITQVNGRQFQNFQKSRGWFISKITSTKHVISGSSHQTNKHFVLKLISFNSG